MLQSQVQHTPCRQRRYRPTRKICRELGKFKFKVETAVTLLFSPRSRRLNKFLGPLVSQIVPV